jgi:uncharacterized protein YgiM (DUF1202 family)
VSSLALRAGPSTGNRILTTLNLNDRVEMLGANAAGWSQVRDLRTNIIGWVASRYLESFPVRRRASAKTRPKGTQSETPKART